MSMLLKYIATKILEAKNNILQLKLQLHLKKKQTGKAVQILFIDWTAKDIIAF